MLDHLENLRDCLVVYESAKSRAQKAQICRRIIERAGKDTRTPIIKRRGRRAEGGRVVLQPIQRGHDCRKNPDEENRDLIDRLKIKMVRLVDLIVGEESR